MQPLYDPLATPRRQYDVDDYIDILRRHKAWILAPAFAGLVVATVVAFLWPDTFISQAVIRVIPPQVPERLVPTNVNAEMSQRVNSMAQSILSRATLTNIINTYNLYPRDRKRLPMEDVVESMRKDIRIGSVGALAGPQEQRVSAFRITFAYDNRYQAQKVCSDLVSRFIDENLRTRASQSTMTTDFIRDQVEQRRRDLDAIEKQLTEFRMQNAGRLPEQVQGNMAAMNAIETRISNLGGNLNRANQDKMMLESRMSILRDQMKFVSQSATPEATTTAAKNERLVQLEREIVGAETRLAAMKEQYKESHPDVQNMASAINVLKRQRDLLTKEEEARKSAPPSEEKKNRPLTAGQTREVRDVEVAIQATQTQIQAKTQEIEQLNKEIQDAQRLARGYQDRMVSAPIGESRYDELLRERGLARAKYEEMAAKMAISQSATELENRKQGETLELLDAASLPATPAEPVRWVIIASGGAIGLVLGTFLAGLREVKDNSLKSLKDVRAYTQLTVLGSIPLLENDLVVRRRRRLMWLAWCTASLAGLLIMAGSVIFYYSSRA
jgi:polysaccharide chain length determinant protein (PEP-CTERM system associated)